MGVLTTVKGETYTTPLFLPVYEYGNQFFSLHTLQADFAINHIITNAYFLYRKRELKTLVREQGIKSFLDFAGLVVTDSGAFQQFSGPLYLSNPTIIDFQQAIGADIISPLDVITTPADNHPTAKKKLEVTLTRIKAGLSIADRSTLIGVQQGGRFLDLRQQALQGLMELGVTYIALGSLVPFFNKNHHIEFIGKVIKQARQIVPPHIPLHLYGGGDPLELPFYIALGCDIFDSSSFIHYARGGWYMTPYGALKGSKTLNPGEYTCPCPYCQRDQHDDLAFWQNEILLASHNLWTILDVMATARQFMNSGNPLTYLNHVAAIHQSWFPESRLLASWNLLREGTPLDE